MLTKSFPAGIACLGLLLAGCDDDVNPVTPEQPAASYQYFLGIQSDADPEVDVLSYAPSIDTGVVSPVNNGFEQVAWMSFIQGVDQIITSGYTSAPEFTSYELVDGELAKGESFFTEGEIYARDVLDASTMVLVASPREGFGPKRIYVVDTDGMSITRQVEVDFGNDVPDSLLAFPNDVEVVDDKLFIAYYHTHARGDFSTPSDSEASVAVFSYPDLEFEKIITDERAPDVGRYFGTTTLELDEQGRIYTFSPSSSAAGYFPVPPKNSGILRIDAATAEFDSSFHIDFEALSGGYKVYNFVYVKDGKAVVQVVKEDETDVDNLWAGYDAPSESPVIETGILDLETRSLELLPDVPKSGGGFDGSYRIEGNLAYLGISNSEYAGIYIIDVDAGTATRGADVDGNYAKAILALEVTE